jgi:hypothetical protein
MDSDDEEEQMFTEMFEEEMAAAAQDEEHMLILACMSGLYAEAAIGRRGGSAPGHKKCKPRQRMKGYCILYADYFADNPLHGETVFRHRFRMSRKLFLKIIYALRDYDPYFRCKLDCTGMAGFSALQKCTVAIPYEREGPLAQPNHQVPVSWTAFIAMRQEIRDSTIHQLLQDDLVEHIWRFRGNTN